MRYLALGVCPLVSRCVIQAYIWPFGDASGSICGICGICLWDHPQLRGVDS